MYCLQKPISRGFIAFFTCLVLLLGTSQKYVFAKTLPQNGKDYLIVPNPIPPQVNTNNQVQLFLWYGCHTCLKLEQILKRYPQTQYWQRLPANLAANWRVSSKTFFVLRELQEPFDMDLQLMEATHDLGSDFTDLDSIVNFLSNLGLNQKDFLQQYRSTEINQKIIQQKVFEKRIGLKKIPAALVNGKYLVDITMVSSFNEFLDRINYLQTLPTTQIGQK